MAEGRCEACGATYATAEGSCASRFDELLALDHSHREPWGSRHGLAFAVYAAQHPERYGVASARAGLARLAREFAPGSVGPAFGPHAPFRVTIADLGDFAAETYAADLERWCRATLAAFAAVPGAE